MIYALHFRTRNYAISTDIGKAFLHIHLYESGRDYSRFFWLSDPTNPNSELVSYVQFYDGPFIGAVSSPFMLYAAVYHHLQRFNTSFSHEIQINLYFDNIVSGCEIESAVIQYCNQARVIISEA